MKNTLYWNKNYALERIIIHVGGEYNYTHKPVYIAPMWTTSFMGYGLHAIKSNTDTVWVIESIEETKNATHIDFNQIIWFENETLRLLYCKS